MFAVAQRENVDDPLPEYLYNVGTVVRIIQTHRVRGGVQLLVQGEGRAQALTYHNEGQAMLQAVLLDMENQPPQNPTDPVFQALDRELRDRAAELGTRRGVPAEALNQLIQGVDDPGPFADLVAFWRRSMMMLACVLASSPWSASSHASTLRRTSRRKCSRS